MGFSRVLIANRGEIALRIMRSLRTLGIGASIIHGREDRTSLPVRWSDSAVRVYRDDPLSSYLDVEAVVDAAKNVGADAVHPVHPEWTYDETSRAVKRAISSRSRDE